MASPAMFIALLLAFPIVRQGEPATPVLALAPPSVAAQAGSIVLVGVYFRNASTEVLSVRPPAEIDAEIVTPQARARVPLVRKGDGSEPKQLAAGESLFVEYSLDLPDEIAAGRVVVQLARLTAAPAVIDVEAAAATDAAEVPVAPPPVESAEETPLDPGAVPPPPAPFQFAEGALQRFHAYEPMYFVGGFDRPNVRFQFSFQYQIFNPAGPWVGSVPFLKGLFLGYAQTGLWDLEGDSKPFTDTNYRPELAWSKDKLEWLDIPGVAQTGLQFGVQHESNGRDGRKSRSINVAYIRPVFHCGDPKGFVAQIASKYYVYWPDRDDNPDISEYRGFCDLRVAAGWSDGFQASATGRLGSEGDRGSIQIDLRYPLRALGDGNFDMYLQLQWFSGYGERLITYDEYTDALRFGIGFVRLECVRLECVP